MEDKSKRKRQKRQKIAKEAPKKATNNDDDEKTTTTISPVVKCSSTADTTNNGQRKQKPLLLLCEGEYDLHSQSVVSLLPDLLAPHMTTAEFLHEHFRRNAVYIPVVAQNNKDDDKKRIQTLSERYLHNLDPELLLRDTASESIFVWLPTATNDNAKSNKKQPAATATASTIQSIEVTDPDAALALFRAGHASYCRAPAATENLLVATLLEETGLGCGQYYSGDGAGANTLGRGEVEVFMGARNGAVTNWHYDFQENFTIQLSGRKRWKLRRGTVAHPLRACTPHYQSPETVASQLKATRLVYRENDAAPFQFGLPQAGVNAIGSVDEVILGPGDVLYFPAGMWHQVEVVEPGVSINISLMAKSYATVVCQALEHYLLRHDRWRACIARPPPSANNNSNNNSNNKRSNGNSSTGGGGVTESLNSLLSELPGLVQDFSRRGGGAQAILPPILQHGKLPKVGEDDNGHESEEDEESGDEDEYGNVVDLNSPPPQVAATAVPRANTIRQRLGTHRLVKNPLALLIPYKDLTQYYASLQAENEEKESDEDTTGFLYDLHVNYAGNEAHESAIEVRFKSQYEQLGEMFGNDDKVEVSVVQMLEDEKCNTISWFLHYGFLVWIERDKL